MNKYTMNKPALMALLSFCMVNGVSAGPFSDQDRPYVDFDESMEFSKQDSFVELREEKKNDPTMKFSRALYEKNNMKMLEPQDEPIIPKIIHIIWVGPLSPPRIILRCFESIKKYLPDWELKVWTDEDIESLNLYNKYYYDKEECYGAKADILRYELLYRFGGVYLDIDFVLLKPLDILHHTYEFYTSMMPGDCHDYIANGVIGCVPGHPIMKHCIETIKDDSDKGHLLLRTGPAHFRKSFYSVMTTQKLDRVVALPKSYFLPYDQFFQGKSDEENARQIKPESFAVHYWANSWGASMPGAWGCPGKKKDA